MSRARRKPKPTPAHYGAPLAFLAAVTVAVLLVHAGLSHRSKQETGPVTTVVPTTTVVTRTGSGKPDGKRAFYAVRTGDTFGSIAAKEGISVEQLQSLNPNVSSNSLRVGQKLRVK
jgi:LysM repeat protein